MSGERSLKLGMFLRVGMIAIALPLSAVVMIRTYAVLKATQITRYRLATALTTGEDLKRENDALRANSNLRVKHLAAARWNADFVGRFYQLCREPSDLPRIMTDFIIHEDASFATGQIEMAFSVPDGSHALELSIQQGVPAGMDPMSGETTRVASPLLASSGYFVRIFPKAADGDGESTSFVVELTSNNTAFVPVRTNLAIPKTQGSARMPEVHNMLPDEPGTHLRWRRMLSRQGRDLYITYPNSLTLIDGNSVNPKPKFGIELARCDIEASDIPMTVRLSLTSDAPLCISAESANQLNSRLSSQAKLIRPYSGNGRFQIASDK